MPNDPEFSVKVQGLTLPVSLDDVFRLRSGTWISDDMVWLGIWVVFSQVPAPRKDPTVALLHPAAFDEVANSGNMPGEERAQEWLKKWLPSLNDLQNVTKVAFPVHSFTFWSLVVVDVNGAAFVYDSSTGTGKTSRDNMSRHRAEMLSRFLWKSTRYWGLTAYKKVGQKGKTSPYWKGLASWDRMPSPQQDGENNDGFFVITNAARLMLDSASHLDFDQALFGGNVQNMREAVTGHVRTAVTDAMVTSDGKTFQSDYASLRRMEAMIGGKQSSVTSQVNDAVLSQEIDSLPSDRIYSMSPEPVLEVYGPEVEFLKHEWTFPPRDKLEVFKDSVESIGNPWPIHYAIVTYWTKKSPEAVTNCFLVRRNQINDLRFARQRYRQVFNLSDDDGISIWPGIPSAPPRPRLVSSTTENRHLEKLMAEPPRSRPGYREVVILLVRCSSALPDTVGDTIARADRYIEESGDVDLGSYVKLSEDDTRNMTLVQAHDLPRHRGIYATFVFHNHSLNKLWYSHQDVQTFFRVFSAFGGGQLRVYGVGIEAFTSLDLAYRPGNYLDQNGWVTRYVHLFGAAQAHGVGLRHDLAPSERRLEYLPAELYSKMLNVVTDEDVRLDWAALGPLERFAWLLAEARRSRLRKSIGGDETIRVNGNLVVQNTIVAGVFLGPHQFRDFLDDH